MRKTAMTYVSSAKAYRTLFLIVKAVVLPVLGPEFTISTCKGDMYQEEEILCLADDHRKNRHLATLFIRTARSRRGTCWSQLEVETSLTVGAC